MFKMQQDSWAARNILLYCSVIVFILSSPIIVFLLVFCFCLVSFMQHATFDFGTRANTFKQPHSLSEQWGPNLFFFFSQEIHETKNSNYDKHDLWIIPATSFPQLTTASMSLSVGYFRQEKNHKQVKASILFDASEPSLIIIKEKT